MADLNSIINCGICGEKIKYGLCFDRRCSDCQFMGFHVWGFGERGEMERNKLPIEEQKVIIENKC